MSDDKVVTINEDSDVIIDSQEGSEHSRELKKLIQDLSENRNIYRGLLKRVRGFSLDLEALFPDTKDFRSRHNMELKMKTLSEVISAELSIAKQIDDSIKTEFELRRKQGEGAEEEIPLRELVEALDSYEKSKERSI